MRIDSSGAVIINNAGSDAQLYLGGASGTSRMYLARSGTESLLFNVDSGAMRFGTNNAEAMRIDSSGNLLVGKSGSSATTQGIEARADGRLWVSTSSDDSIFNRAGTDGGILSFRKDGTTVGSIASRAGVVSTIILDPRTPTASAGAGLGTTSAKIVPADTSGLTDGKSDLGDSGNRFKDGHFSGTVNAANFNTTSDATLKTNVETLTGSLDAVKSLRGVSYDWIESGGSEIGVIAQEVEAVLPDVVSTNDEGIKSVKYGNMVAVLIEAIKEQQLRIEALELKLGE